MGMASHDEAPPDGPNRHLYVPRDKIRLRSSCCYLQTHGTFNLNLKSN